MSKNLSVSRPHLTCVNKINALESFGIFFVSFCFLWLCLNHSRCLDTLMQKSSHCKVVEEFDRKINENKRLKKAICPQR